MHDRLVAVDNTLAKVAFEILVARQAAPLRPRCLQFARGSYSRPFIRGNDGEKTLVPDHSYTRQVRNRGFVDRYQRRANRWRTNHPAMQHARDGKVLDVLIASRALRRHVGSSRRLANRE